MNMGRSAVLLFLRRNTNYQSVLFITKILYLIEFFFFICLEVHKLVL